MFCTDVSNINHLIRENIKIKTNEEGWIVEGVFRLYRCPLEEEFSVQRYRKILEKT